MLLPLAYYGNPILRRKGDNIVEITQDIRTLVEDMIETMNHARGIGLAAPQVHRSLALFITAPTSTFEGDLWVPGPVHVFINPRLYDPSEETWEYSEACLSIPKLYGPVIRPWKITVEAQNLEGQWIKEEFSGLDARVIMHENDHINGVLFIDRVPQKIRKELEPSLRDIKKKFKN